MHDQRSLGKCRVGGWGSVRGIGKWFVKIRGGTIGWFVVCMGNGVQDKFVMAHGKENGQWELRGLIKHDELRDMGHLVPMNKEAY